MLFQHIIDCEEVIKAFFANAGSGIDSQARATVTALLVQSPSTRLGMLHDGLAGIWTSPFFKGVSLEIVTKKQQSPPFV